MAAPRRVIEISIGDEDLAQLETIARSRTEPACRVERARILLAYRADPSAYAVGEAIGVTHQTVQRCMRRAERLGVMAALDDSPRPGKTPDITDDARAWGGSPACKILAHHEVKPHKVRYYLDRRDEALEEKMAEVLCVYREVAVLKAGEAS